MKVVGRLGRIKARARASKAPIHSILPTLFALGNLACGFAAIHFALRGLFEGRAETRWTNWLFRSHLLDRLVPSFITLAAFTSPGMFCDMLDGLVAQVTRRTSDFGGQLIRWLIWSPPE
jgi:phosphatidylserine synthase